SVELGEAVHRALEQVGPGMLEAVPARVVGRIAETEVGPLVDDRGARGNQVHVGMPCQDADELGADVAGSTDDPDLDPPRPAGAIEPAQGPRESPVCL